MRVRQVLIAMVLVSAGAVPAGAQTAQPYFVGEVGGSFGDGSASPAFGVGFGYLTARNLGFEIEASFVPSLDFGDPGFPRIAIFPPVSIESTGRLISLQTHVVGVLPSGGSKLRAFVLAGGGIADVKIRTRVHVPDFGPIFPDLPTTPDLPTLPGFPPPPNFRDILLGFDRENTASETSMVLGAGAGVEYALTQRLGVGMVVRYQHVFNEPLSLDMARAAVRATWRF